MNTIREVVNFLTEHESSDRGQALEDIAQALYGTASDLSYLDENNDLRDKVDEIESIASDIDYEANNLEDEEYIVIDRESAVIVTATAKAFRELVNDHELDNVIVTTAWQFKHKALPSILEVTGVASKIARLENQIAELQKLISDAGMEVAS
jgi:hypothetical protein